jgi:acetate kinase
LKRDGIQLNILAYLESAHAKKTHTIYEMLHRASDLDGIFGMTERIEHVWQVWKVTSNVRSLELTGT